MIRFKICCINSINEANLAIRYGAHAIGLVGKMPSGPGPIEDSLITTIARSVPPLISTFLLTSESKASGIIEHHKRTQTNTIQLVDELEDLAYEKIRIALPEIKLVQVIHVIDHKSIDHAIKISQYVDAILLDSGNPNLKVKELGGTGRVHDWKLSREIVERVPIPVILAGGLNPSNVKEAIKVVQPFAIDVCSGLRKNGYLDETLLRAFTESLVI